MVGILSTMNTMNNILIPRTRNVPSSILPKFDCYNRVSLNSLGQWEPLLDLFLYKQRSGSYQHLWLHPTSNEHLVLRTPGFQRLHGPHYISLGSDDLLVTVLVHTPGFHTTTIQEFYWNFISGVFSDPQFLSIILPGNSLFSCPGIRLHLSCIQ